MYHIDKTLFNRATNLARQIKAEGGTDSQLTELVALVLEIDETAETCDPFESVPRVLWALHDEPLFKS
jgi:hypothetical protein